MGTQANGVTIHPTAVVHDSAAIGKGTVIWSHACIGADVVIGEDCRIGHAAYVDRGVKIGNRVVLQSGAAVFRPWRLGHEAFVGPNATLTNDRDPHSQRTRDTDGLIFKMGDGAVVGAGAVVLSDVQLGAHSFIAAAALVSRDTVSYGLYVGSPARLKGYRCTCSARYSEEEGLPRRCSECQKTY